MEYGISIGSNLGDRPRQLREARARIAQLPDVAVVASSALYETEPVDVGPAYRDQAFLNAVLILTALDPPEILAVALRRIEDELGRVRVADRNAPRPIDLDLIYAGVLVRECRALTIPHPRWNERRFVVQPLSDVRPDLLLPGQTATVREILAALPLQPRVALFAREW
ncbi:MAG: 2-amino-4-hydroxy-6-hydroxymethyldihydropteridine diphosphokinase [Lentisphaerae bacterium]|nr:2-amino-4-hydroxy-6-hydroxymethyldihydropteridine diphosphokinase [Lentisphaerota bacterium]